jgi:DNA anti-recombination protein RmuC
MELMAWTDERLAERFDRIDERFDEVNRRITESDAETRRQIAEVNRRVTEASAASNHQFGEVHRRTDEVKEEVAELRQGIWALQRALSRGSFGVIIGLVGVIAAILTKGG